MGLKHVLTCLLESELRQVTRCRGKEQQGTGWRQRGRQGSTSWERAKRTSSSLVCVHWHRKPKCHHSAMQVAALLNRSFLLALAESSISPPRPASHEGKLVSAYLHSTVSHIHLVPPKEISSIPAEGEVHYQKIWTARSFGNEGTQL